MRNLLWLSLGSLCLLTNLSASTITVEYSITGGDQFNYTFIGTLGVDQAIDIQFDPGVYASISNPQPNPIAGVWNVFDLPSIGGPADYVAEALSATSPMNEPFSVQFTLQAGEQAGPQLFTVDQYDSNGVFQSHLQAATFTQLDAPTPEPSSFALSALGLCVIGAYRARRRAKQPVAS